VLVLAIVLTLAHRHTFASPSNDALRGPSAAAATPRIRHVFVINIENKGFHTTWGTHSAAPYLATTLRMKGVLLSRYYGTAHHSLGNYLAQISGQGPDLAIQHDCPVYSRFTEIRPERAPDQVVGDGCVYPKKVGTLPEQLVGAGLSWRGYMQDMAKPCQHSRLGAHERWSSATKREQYATRHNPFMYFRSITSRPSYCRAHVRSLSALTGDLRTKSRTRTLSYITPDLCHDAHDARCADGGPGGLRAANKWFKNWVPRILRSPAFKANGMLVITADESEGVREDSRGCCGEGVGPNAGQPGIEGPGGGRIGALVISPYVAPGTSSDRAYNHYSLLGSIEDLFGLPRLGYARTVSDVFGDDVYHAS
jgi:phosphatidylinositol-3-phosphatase